MSARLFGPLPGLFALLLGVAAAPPAAADQPLAFAGYSLSLGTATEPGAPSLSGLSVASRSLLTSLRPRCFVPLDRANGMVEVPLRPGAAPRVTEDGTVTTTGTGAAQAAGVSYAVRYEGTLRCRAEGCLEVEFRFSSDRDAYLDCGVYLTLDRASLGTQPLKALALGGGVEERRLDPGLPPGVMLNYYGHDLQRVEAGTPLGLPLALSFPPGMTFQAWDQAYTWQVFNAAQKYWAYSWGRPRVWRRWVAERQYPVRFRLVLPVAGAAEAAARLPWPGTETIATAAAGPDLEALRRNAARRTSEVAWLAHLKHRGGELARAEGTVSDHWARPEIDRGTFRVEGRLRYLVGPWLGCAHSVDGRFNTSAFAGGDSLLAAAYSRPVDRELAAGLGFGTGHPDLSCFYALQQLGEQSGRPAGQSRQDRADAMAYLLEGLRGLPLVVECLPGLLKEVAEKRFPGEPLAHDNPGWHEFVTLNFAHPDARRLYTEMFQAAARAAGAAGGNVLLYELFNEPVYNSLDPATRERFARRAQATYGTIATANATWGTQFADFAAAAASKDFRESAGLWVDWLKHNAREWCEGLEAFKGAIRAVDPRPGVRFAVQPAVTFTYKTLRNGNNAIDLWQQAQVTDVVTVEGGYSFCDDPPEVGGDQAEMLAHINAGLLSLPYFLDVSRALAEDRKPVTDHELNITRYAGGERVPTRRADFPTALWSELVHGCSLDILYSWDRRAWEWQDLLGAYEMVRTPSYKSSCLLNPYAYPPESLHGIRDFQQEVDGLAELVLPMPRTSNRVAVLFSTPSLRMDSLRSSNFGTAMTEAHSALLYAHHPPDFVFEEQLGEAAHTGRYGALVLPCATHVSADTPRRLEAYVRAGGTLIALAGSLRHDEYDRDLPPSLFGAEVEELAVPRPVRLRPLAATTVPLPYLEVDREERLHLREAEALAAADDGETLIARRRLGKGLVYSVGGRASGGHLCALLEGVLADAKVGKAVDVVAEDGSYVANVELETIDRGDRKLVFLLNWSSRTAQRVRVRVSEPGPWRVRDVVSGRSLPRGLEEAVVLPPQERVLLLLERGR